MSSDAILYIIRMRILIIEDEEKVATFLQKGFEAEGFAVDTAPDGIAGIRMASGGIYDAIILDVMLPAKNGFSVVSDLRKDGNQTPVLMLSARSELEDRVEGLNLGADDYLPKPFAFTEVLARVRALMRRRTPEATGLVLTAGDLTLDLPTREVKRGGKQITLTNKEFELLEHLLRNKGRVLSRVILTERIWDMNFDTQTNIVDVMINRLRRKIDDDFDTKLIHTVRGVGYAVKEPSDETPAHR